MKTRKSGKNRIPLEGQTFGNWYADSYVGERRYLCKCVCGVTRVVDGQSLSTGSSKSCGCGVYTKNRIKDKAPFKPEDKVE